MCRLTSQMNPNSAQMSVAMNNAIGSATHGGRLNLRPAYSARLLQPRDAALPVQVADPEQPSGDDHGHDRHADHLIECGAAALVCPERPPKPTLTPAKTPLPSPPAECCRTELTLE